MRKIFVILVVSMLLMSALAPAALAEPKPADEYIPMLVDPDPGYAFEDWWIELNPDDGGNGIEVPQTATFNGVVQNSDNVYGDPDPEADPYTGKDLYRGFDMGFNFKFFEGPAMGIPVYGWVDDDGKPGTPDVWTAVKWSTQLTNDGYDGVWIGENGYLVFGGPLQKKELGLLEITAAELQLHASVPSPVQPNNLVMPFLTDLVIGDNTFIEVDSVAFVCTDNCKPNAKADATCDKGSPGEKKDAVTGPDGCKGNKCDPVTGYWVPCTMSEIVRPRGRLLYKTVGEEPNRKFVVEWANARVFEAGGLATFQAQLWEGNNAILFLYKDFKPLAFFEDPPHEAAFVLHQALVHGVEDFYGQIGVGFAYHGMPTASPQGWALFNPIDELSAVAFAPDAYTGMRPFVP